MSVTIEEQAARERAGVSGRMNVGAIGRQRAVLVVWYVDGSVLPVVRLSPRSIQPMVIVYVGGVPAFQTMVVVVASAGSAAATRVPHSTRSHAARPETVVQSGMVPAGMDAVFVPPH